MAFADADLRSPGTFANANLSGTTDVAVAPSETGVTTGAESPTLTQNHVLTPTDGTSGITGEKTVDTSDTIDSMSDTVVDSQGRIYVAWSNQGDMYVSYSDDGTTWTDVNVASGSGTYFQRHPRLAVDSSDVVYLVWQGDNGTDTNYDNIRFSKSSNRGTSWGTPVDVSTGTSHKYEPAIALESDGTIHVVAERASGSIGYYYSTNGGTSFTQYGTISGLITSCYGADIAIDTSDNIIVVFAGYSGSYQDILSVVSTDGGANWGTQVNVTSSTSASYSYPKVCTDSSDYIYIAYYNGAGTIHLGKSTNGGTSYSTSTIDSGTSCGNPCISCDSDDVLHVVYAWLPGTTNYMYYRSSSNSGTSWSSTTTLSTETTGAGYTRPNLNKALILDYVATYVRAESGNYDVHVYCSIEGVSGAGVTTGAEQPTLSVQIPALEPNECGVTTGAESPTLTQNHVLGGSTDVGVTTGAGQPTVAIDIQLTPNEAGVTTGAEQPTLATSINVTPNECGVTTGAEQPTLTQNHVLAPNEAGVTTDAEQPTLSQVHVLTPNETGVTTGSEQPTVSQNVVITPNEAGVTTGAEQPTLTAELTVTPNETGVTTGAEEPTLSQDHYLVPNDAGASTGSESPAIGQNHVIAPDEAGVTTGAEEAPVVTEYIFSPNECGVTTGSEMPQAGEVLDIALIPDDCGVTTGADEPRFYTITEKVYLFSHITDTVYLKSKIVDVVNLKSHIEDVVYRKSYLMQGR